MQQPYILLAYFDQKVVGATKIRTIDRQALTIERLAVLPKANRNGIGKNQEKMRSQ
jgi:hypothetical protein